jgi:peptidoglycan/xylan/chitin deacetylase (PgdA/CDA1 family)
MPAPDPSTKGASVLGHRWLEAAARTVTGGRLRVLAYHGVSDGAAFRSQLEHLVAHYRPVTGARVAAALAGGAPLPDRAVWVTFDDGRPSVVERGLPELDRCGVPATLFVCPGVVATGEPYWFDVVERAVALPGGFRHEGRDRTDAGLVTELKSVPDPHRRAVAADALERLHAAGVGAPRQLSPEELARWTASGHEVGNHTWDHPCLDRCTPEEQRRQVLDAHEWLAGLLGSAPTLFAYPNGDWTPTVEAVLAGAGYAVAGMFDHHLVGRRPEPLRLSRLRLDAAAPPARFRAIVGGTHSGAFRAVGAVRSALGR